MQEEWGVTNNYSGKQSLARAILGKLRPMVTLALKSEKIFGPVSLKIPKVFLDQDPPFLDERSNTWREATYSWLSLE